MPILLQKPFWGDERKLSEPLMRPAPRDVHGPSHWRYGTLQRYSHPKISFREIFGVVRFSTFATKSAMNGHTDLTGTKEKAEGGLFSSSWGPRSKPQTLAASLDARSAESCGMPMLARRLSPHDRETWYVYYGDVRVGAIGNPRRP